MLLSVAEKLLTPPPFPQGTKAVNNDWSLICRELISVDS